MTKLKNESDLPEVVHTIGLDSAGNLTAGVTGSGGLFALSLSGAGTAPAVAVGAGAGSGASILAGSQTGHDMGGSFTITTAGTPAAGALATVTFCSPLSASPASIVVNCWDTNSATGIAVGVTSVSATGFTVSGPATTTAHHLLVNYQVIAS